MIIGLLEPGDEALLGAATKALDNTDLCGERAAFLLAEPTFLCIVAHDNGEIMGRVYGHVLHRPKRTDFLIYEIDVLPAHQKKGVGRALLDHLNALCRERGYGESWVLTEADNTAANALYASAGGHVEAFPTRMFVFPA